MPTISRKIYAFCFIDCPVPELSSEVPYLQFQKWHCILPSHLFPFSNGVIRIQPHCRNGPIVQCGVCQAAAG